MTHPADIPLSAVVLTYNEEENLERCLASLRGWPGEVVVVDSFSTDRTLEIARRHTHKIHQHAYESHPAQWTWLLENVPLEHEYVLAVDADFAVSPKLQGALRELFTRPEELLDGYYVRHRQVFCGRPLRFGTIYPRYWLRLFRRDAVYLDVQDEVDVHFYVRGSVGKIEHDVVEDNVKDRDLAAWVEKQIRFAKRQAREEVARRDRPDAPLAPAFFGLPDQRTLWLKQRWNRLPLYLRPAALFGYRYFARLGFLDGKEGFLYHFTQAFLYRVLVDYYLDRLRRGERAL